MIDKAVAHFGTTHNIKECGYILTDGKMLDFSGFKFGGLRGYRSIDHREIADIYEIEISGNDAMIDFMNQGNIRVNSESGGLDISNMSMLTKEQKSTIRDYVSYFNGEIIIDISNSNGDNVHSCEYPVKTSASRILSDIQKAIIETK